LANNADSIAVESANVRDTLHYGVLREIFDDTLDLDVSWAAEDHHKKTAAL
jgi:hypothetical protein